MTFQVRMPPSYNSCSTTKNTANFMDPLAICQKVLRIEANTHGWEMPLLALQRHWLDLPTRTLINRWFYLFIKHTPPISVNLSQIGLFKISACSNFPPLSVA